MNHTYKMKQLLLIIIILYTTAYGSAQTGDTLPIIRYESLQEHWLHIPRDTGVIGLLDTVRHRVKNGYEMAALPMNVLVKEKYIYLPYTVSLNGHIGLYIEKINQSDGEPVAAYKHLHPKSSYFNHSSEERISMHFNEDSTQIEIIMLRDVDLTDKMFEKGVLSTLILDAGDLHLVKYVVSDDSRTGVARFNLQEVLEGIPPNNPKLFVRRPDGGYDCYEYIHIPEVPKPGKYGIRKTSLSIAGLLLSRDSFLTEDRGDKTAYFHFNPILTKDSLLCLPVLFGCRDTSLREVSLDYYDLQLNFIKRVNITSDIEPGLFPGEYSYFDGDKIVFRLYTPTDFGHFNSRQNAVFDINGHFTGNFIVNPEHYEASVALKNGVLSWSNWRIIEGRKWSIHYLDWMGADQELYRTRTYEGPDSSGLLVRRMVKLPDGAFLLIADMSREHRSKGRIKWTNYGTSVFCFKEEAITLSEDLAKDPRPRQTYRVRPNPVEDVLEIAFDTEFTGRIGVFDAAGHLNGTVKVKRSNTVLIDVRSLIPGMYWLRPVNQTGDAVPFEVKKVIKR